MGCGCTVEIEIDGFSDTIINENRISTGEEKCDECGGIIPSGESYEFYQGECEGREFTNITCPDCLSIRENFFHDGYYYGQVLEYFYNFINEAGGEISEECIAKLTPHAQEIACSSIEEEWNEFYLDNPIQPAVRLEKMNKRLKSWERPGWMHYRNKEISNLSETIWS